MREKSPTPKTQEGLFQTIMDHPVWAYFHMRYGLMEKVSENGEDILDALKDIGESLADLVVYLLIALWHIACVPVYPIVKLQSLMTLRRNIKENPNSLNVNITRESIDE